MSVVVPAFDEVDRIGATVGRVLAFLDSQPYSSELIVVLDGGRPGADRAIADADPHVRFSQTGSWSSTTVETAARDFLSERE